METLQYYLAKLCLWTSIFSNIFLYDDVNFRSDDGNTALHLACMVGDERMVRFLLEHGANRCIQNDEGLLASDYAESIGHTGILELFGK